MKEQERKMGIITTGPESFREQQHNKQTIRNKRSGNV
jgi:hypothetical protein